MQEMENGKDMLAKEFGEADATRPYCYGHAIWLMRRFGGCSDGPWSCYEEAVPL